MTLLAITGQELVQQGINALSLGATYALLALGLAMVFSVLGMVNFAHGELVAVAGYTLYLLNEQGVAFVFQVPLALLAAAATATLMERVAFRPLRGSGFTTLLLSSFAVSVIIQNAFLAFVSPRPRGVPLPDWMGGVLKVGPFTVGWLQVITASVAMVSLLVLTAFLRRSKYGLGMLAAAQDFQAARLVGVRANRVISSAFAISGLLAGVVAIFLVARRGTVDPTMGFIPVVKAFIATVIGGLGSLSGAVAGGFILAAIEVSLDTLLPVSVLPFRDAFALSIVILILYTRPDGIFAKSQEIAA